MKHFLEAMRQAFRTTIGGMWLVFLLYGTIWISVGSLAAIQLRAKLDDADATPTERAQSFADVEMAFRQFSLREQGINDGINALYQNLWEEQDRRARLQTEREAAVAGVAAALAKDPKSLDPVAFENGIEFRLNAKNCDQIGEEDYDIAPTHCQAYFNYLAIDMKGIEDKIAGIWTEINAAETEGGTQLKSLMNDESLSQHFPTYRFFTNVLGLGFLLTVPSEILVLVVTMAMGILGSVLTMTWLFVRQDGSMTLRRFMTLPLIGAVSAFVVYIFVKAGQLTLTAGDAEDTLNPFVLSFVGVVSGMLSERAYIRISDVGTSFFDVDDGQPRWGTWIKEAMRGQGVSEAELARYLGVTEEEATRIVNETTTATYDQQRLIAACLRRTVRELFTDVPPDAPSAIAAAPVVKAPDLLGLDPGGVEQALRDAGLRFGELKEVGDATAAAGVVLAQSPEPGARVRRGAAVDLVVARGTIQAANPPEEVSGPVRADAPPEETAERPDAPPRA